METTAKKFIIIVLASLAAFQVKAANHPTASDLLRKNKARQASLADVSSESGTPTARELLNKYTDALNAVQSFIAKEESVKKLDYAFDRAFSDRSMAGVKRRGQRQYSRGQKRTDGKRFHWRSYSWGNLGPTHGDVDETQAHYNCDNWDGVTLYGHAGNVKVPGIVTLSKPTASQVEHPMSRTPPVSYLVGYNMESDERMDSILRKAKNISVSSRMENVGGSDCYVIRAKTDKGTISLWIDPAHGYNLAKAEARLSQGDFSFDYRLKRGESRVTKLENVRFERVNGIWVPMEADVSQHRNYSGGTVNEDYHYKRTEFVLNPDHDTLGSFDNPIENPKNDPELKDRTDVCRIGDPNQYIWQGGRVIDKTGKVIMDSQPKQKSDSKESQSETLGKKPPSALDLVRKEQQRKLQATAGADKQRAPDQAKPEPPMVADLLDKLSEALDSAGSTSFIAKGESTQEHEYRFSKNYREPGWRGIRDKGTCYRREEFRTDGERYHLRQYSWGHISSQDSSVPEDRPIFYCLNYAAENELYRHSVRINPGQPGGIVMISKLDSSKTSHMDYRLQGYVLPSHERADLILRRAESISVRPKTEPIGGSDCYAIDAETDSGRISVWIDPAHGHQLAKVEARGTEGDLYLGKPLPRGQQVNSRLENVRFEKVDGVWVPVEVDMSSDLDYGGGSFTRSKTHYKRTEIVLNPDHDDLDSFENPLENPKNDPELKNGTFVRKDGLRYVWQDGKLIPDKDKTAPRDKQEPKRRTRPPRQRRR